MPHTLEFLTEIPDGKEFKGTILILELGSGPKAEYPETRKLQFIVRLIPFPIIHWHSALKIRQQATGTENME